MNPFTLNKTRLNARLAFLGLCALAAGPVASAAPVQEYPQLLIHNFGDKPPMPPAQIAALAKRDVIVLSPIFREDYASIAAIRKLNPRIRILAYTLSFQAGFDAAAWLSNEDEAALFRPTGKSWLVSAPIAKLSAPVAASDRVWKLDAANLAAKRELDEAVLLCEDELLRVVKIEGGQLTVRRGHGGTAVRAHPAGAPVTRVLQPKWATRVYRKRSANAEIVDINISDIAPAIGGKRPWELKADYLESCWKNPRWRQAFDGFFVDEGQVDIRNAPVDLDRDGVAEDTDAAQGALQRGLRALLHRIRERCGPEMLLVLNNTPDIIPDLNGRHREHFVDIGIKDASQDIVGRWNWAPHTWANGIEPLKAWAELGHKPPLLINSSQPGTWDDLRQMRLGLASSSLFNSIFQYRARSGDNRNWQHWFDEYAVDSSGSPTNSPAGLHWLGKPLGPAQQHLVRLASPDLLQNAEWQLALAKPALAEAQLAQKNAVRTVSISKTGVGEPSLVVLKAQSRSALQPGREYTFTFETRASTPRLIDFVILSAAGNANAAKVAVPLYVRADWERTVITCLNQSPRALPNWSLALELGRNSGDVEFRNVTCQEGTGEIGWTREFEGGLVVVNPTRRPQTIAVPAGFQKLAGKQDPKHNDGMPVKAPLLVPPTDAFLLKRISAPPRR